MPTPTWRPTPTGLRRLLFRAPVLAYRAHLGWLFGHRLVLISHRGRRSGRTRQVVVEVAARDRTTGAVTVASGFGTGSNWYRNLLAHPEASIELGTRRVPVRAVPLSAEEGGELMVDYARRRFTSAKVTARSMGITLERTDESARDLGRVLPFLRLEPHASAAR